MVGDDDPTDPGVFQRPEEVTVRRCKCGREISVDESALQRARTSVFNALYALLLSRGLPVDEAAAIVDAVRSFGGFDLL